MFSSIFNMEEDLQRNASCSFADCSNDKEMQLSNSSDADFSSDDMESVSDSPKDEEMLNTNSEDKNCASELRDWLKCQRLDMYFEKFIKKGYDSLDDISSQHLEELTKHVKIKLPGHQRRLRNAVELLESVRKRPPSQTDSVGTDSDKQSTGPGTSTKVKCKFIV